MMRGHLRAAAILVAALVAATQIVFAGTVLADDLAATPQSVTATASATVTASATATPTWTPTAQAPVRSEATATPTKVSTKTTKPGKKHRKRATPEAELTGTPTPQAEPTKASKGHRARHKGRKHRAKKATPTPTPTATPFLNLNAEDSISPVTCNGTGKSPASRPFLSAPFAGWTSIVSYFDHDSPNFLKDGLMVTANGMEAKPDSLHVRTDFPAYWNAGVRQYLDYDGHNGYDYDLWYQPVHAAAKGKVIFAHMEYPTMPDHGYGNMIMIAHSHGYVTLYGHLSKFLVKKGQRVRAGQQIAVSGNTGHSTGPHLHFTVFHNCTPTDPYGWAGGGPDPLTTYQGEASLYLWKSEPLVSNPLPNWPGSSALPSAGERRIVLLQLPDARLGTTRFTQALKARAMAVQRALGGKKMATIDMLRGAVDTTAPLTAAAILKLPGVVSITTTDAVDGARGDLLHTLARAALTEPHHSVKLSTKGDWTGYLIEWQGRTMLVGTGQRGRSVRLRVGGGKGGGSTHRVVTDPTSGAYVIDLGRLSRSEREELKAELNRATSRRAPLVSAAPVTPTPRRVVARAVRPGPQETGAGIGILLAIIAMAAVGGGMFLSRRVARRTVTGGE